MTAAAETAGQMSASAELERVNIELARLFEREPASLVTGADTSRRDPLVICGLLGGKDVGKSTLINALAGEEVSVDREEVGAGTSRPLVYVHQDMVATARARLAEVCRSVSADVRFFTHRVDAIRNVALVDLPDFDSDFRQHEAIARAVSPGLDRVIWVVTPRKIADRAWVTFARDVIKANSNVYFVLNKSDELLSDEEGWGVPGRPEGEIRERAAEFAGEQREWACGVLRQAGYEVQSEHLFLVAARYAQPAVFVQRVAAIWDDPQWRQYGPDRDVVASIGEAITGELDRLREIVLAPVDPALAARIKEENLRAQVRRNVERVRDHFELGHWIRQVRRVLDPEYRQVLANGAFGPEFCRLLASRLLRSRRSDVELADEVMDARAGQWPVLRVVYWLSRWAIRRMGRAVTGSVGRQGDANIPARDDLFQIRARGLTDRVSSIVDRLNIDHGPVIRQLRLQPPTEAPAELAGQIEAELAELPVRGDQELVDRLSREYRPAVWGRVLVWAVLLWFPLVQPIAEGFLEMSAAGTRMTDWLHGLYRIVFALGAVQLLHGLAVVAIIFVAVLAAIYGRCVRDVQAGRRADAGGYDLARSGRHEDGVTGLTEPGSDQASVVQRAHGARPGPSVRGAPGSQSPARTNARGAPDSWSPARTSVRGGRRATALADFQQEVDGLSQEIDDLLLAGVVGPVLRPFEVAAGQLEQFEQRMSAVKC